MSKLYLICIEDIFKTDQLFVQFLYSFLKCLKRFPSHSDSKINDVNTIVTLCAIKMCFYLILAKCFLNLIYIHRKMCVCMKRVPKKRWIVFLFVSETWDFSWYLKRWFMENRINLPLQIFRCPPTHFAYSLFFLKMDVFVLRGLRILTTRVTDWVDSQVVDMQQSTPGT